MAAETFSEGKEFANYEQFLEAFHCFCNAKYEPFIITTNNKRQVVLHCRHGYRRPSESTGMRTHLRYNYLACEAKISCYKPANSTRVKITSMNLQHNHEVSKSAFGTTHLTEKEKEVVHDLHKENCKVSQICRVLKSKFDKNLSSQKLRNLIRKLTSEDDHSSERASHATLKSLAIYDTDACISSLNREAALALNERGCVLFHRSLTALEKRREYMNIEDTFVCEKYGDEETVYECSTTTCICTYFSQNQTPCRHILLKREQETGSLLSIFSANLFHTRYHRSNSTTSSQNVLPSCSQSVSSCEEELDENVPADSSLTVLKTRDKYNKIFPIMLNIATLAANHGTSQFTKYLNVMKEVETLVRAGCDVTLGASKQLTNGPRVDHKSEDEDTLTPHSLLPNTQDSLLPANSSGQNKFGNLTFRSKPKSQGRPKRTDRQLSFNKTRSDRKGASDDRRGQKRKAANVTKRATKRLCRKGTDDVLHLECPQSAVCPSA